MTLTVYFQLEMIRPEGDVVDTMSFDSKIQAIGKAQQQQSLDFRMRQCVVFFGVVQCGK